MATQRPQWSPSRDMMNSRFTKARGRHSNLTRRTSDGTGVTDGRVHDRGARPARRGGIPAARHPRGKERPDVPDAAAPGRRRPGRPGGDPPVPDRSLGGGARRCASPRPRDQVARLGNGPLAGRAARDELGAGHLLGDRVRLAHVREALRGVPACITRIDGVDIHFLHVRSKHEDALPLIVTHGWPGSTVEQLKIVEPLTDPTAHGASAADAFHLVIPSLPGGVSAVLKNARAISNWRFDGCLSTCGDSGDRRGRG